MKALIFAITLGLLHSALCLDYHLHADEDAFSSVFHPDALPKGAADFNKFIHKSAGNMKDWIVNEGFGSPLWTWFNQKTAAERPDDAYMAEYPYWRFLPRVMGTIAPGAPPLKWSNWCFTENTLSVVETNATGITLEFTRGFPSKPFCSDSYAFLATTVFSFHTVDLVGTHNIHIPFVKNISAADRFDIEHTGIRVGAFVVSPVNLLKALNSTVDMFLEPETKKPVSPKAAQVNLDFLRKYAGIDMPALPSRPVFPRAQDIHSGDVFGGIRFDGLDPMLAWAMGSSTGHVATAIWIDDELWVTESTTTSSYWPTNGIQKTPWNQWTKQVNDSDYHFVWLPLKEEYRNKFDAKRTHDTLARFLGLPYGFHNMLWAWIDTPTDNFPCLAPDWNTCLDWRVVMPLFGFADYLTKGGVALLWVDAFNMRLNTTGLNTAEIYQTLANRNIAVTDLITMVERDDWQYHDGYSRMCDAWVCQMLKAGGVFGDLETQFECTECTNWDITSLPFYEKQVQISGQYQMSLKGFGSKTWAPYAHYAEQCGGHAPAYSKGKNC